MTREQQIYLNEELTKITGVRHYPSVEEMFEAKFEEENNFAEERRNEWNANT